MKDAKFAKKVRKLMKSIAPEFQTDVGILHYLSCIRVSNASVATELAAQLASAENAEMDVPTIDDELFTNQAGYDLVATIDRRACGDDVVDAFILRRRNQPVGIVYSTLEDAQEKMWAWHLNKQGGKYIQGGYSTVEAASIAGAETHYRS